MYFTRNIYECNICIYHTAYAGLFARNIIMVVICLSLKKMLSTKIEEEGGGASFREEKQTSF